MMNKLIVVFLLCSVSLKAQLTDNNVPYKTTVFYWFSIKFTKTTDKNTGTDQIFLKYTDNNIETGSFDQFISSHQQGLKDGKVVIGPFSDPGVAQTSQTIYKKSGRIGNSGSGDNNANYSFFYVKPLEADSNMEVKFERIPSRITTGTINDFGAMFSEGLGFDKLAIGPFSEYESAEKSKFTFRKNDDIGIESKLDSTKSRNLKTMARKWKSIKLVMAKAIIDKNTDQVKVRFSTNFPARFFPVDAVQVIKVTATYDDAFETSNTCFSLQGEEVIDNNYAVSFVSNTVYINYLYFDKFGAGKIKGFFFESFIYNDNDIIELDPIYVPYK